MDIRIEKLEKCQTKVVVTTNTETWKSSQEKAFKQIAAKTEIKGFRKGHAPENIVKAHINKAEVLRTASDTIIDEAYQKVLNGEIVDAKTVIAIMYAYQQVHL